MCIAAVVANHYFQFFCRPVPWAKVVLVIAVVPVLMYPWLLEKFQEYQGAVFFIFGIAACICVYCILFIGIMNGL